MAPIEAAIPKRGGISAFTRYEEAVLTSHTLRIRSQHFYKQPI
jgi:hypothetical protein